MTKRPIVVDFDELGRLYVAESSGSNDNVQTQLEERPHSILRLEDRDNDGKFDRRTVFADRMMFPEGALWHGGSLFVAAPPSIWKLTDTDGDGVADRREEWFAGKTLTGCANDLHGPYLGRDGWIYWCKGAFAEQTYQQPGREPLVTRAAHIFRRRPEGGPIEPVMTGGMDNPVEVVFTLGGERIFTTTFFQHPANGQRDGLVHAIYGGVYGKPHGVIDGHPRTGDLMPVMTHLGAAAPSGLACLESSALGFRHQLLTACFNLHKVTRHELVSHGSTFQTQDHDLVACDDLDFHPTDVIEDADGSVLIIDTGGWYKLCCPTSQLHKPDVLGAIYRLRRKDRSPVLDPRGLEIDWSNSTPTSLARLLADSRHVVRHRAIRELRSRGAIAVPFLVEVLKVGEDQTARVNAVWTLCGIDAGAARAATRSALADSDALVRQAAAHAAGLWRDQQAANELKRLLQGDSMPNRRVAAEAIGRLNQAEAVPELLNAVGAALPRDRTLDHSLVYALIETNAAAETRSGLSSDNEQVQLAALTALYQMHTGGLEREELCSLLESEQLPIRARVTEMAASYPQWGEAFAAVLRKQMASHTSGKAARRQLAERIAKLAGSDPVRELIRELMEGNAMDSSFKLAVLGKLEKSSFSGDQWDSLWHSLLTAEDARLVSATVRLLTPRSPTQKQDEILTQRLRAVAKSEEIDKETRLTAMRELRQLDADSFSLAVRCLSADRAPGLRGLAASVVAETELTSDQLFVLADAIPRVSPLELSRVLDAFEEQTDESLGLRLFQALQKSPSAESLPPDRIARLSSKFGRRVSELAKPMYGTTLDPNAQARRLETLLTTLPEGDMRRGQRIFHSEKAACFACHALGYRGGTVGPDLTRIARIRSRRDLLEAVLYPSASFVRSYEPVTILTHDGKTTTGTIKNRGDTHVLLQLNATEQRRIESSMIEEMLPAKVSTMPAGLEKQLSRQELADLLVFLESRK